MGFKIPGLFYFIHEVNFDVLNCFIITLYFNAVTTEFSWALKEVEIRTDRQTEKTME